MSNTKFSSIGIRENRKDEYVANRSRLEEVLQILLPLKAKSTTSLHSSRQSTPGGSESCSVSNRFAALDISDPSNVDGNDPAYHLPATPNNEARATPQPLKGSCEDIVLEDDGIAEWIELSLFLNVSLHDQGSPKT